MKSLNEKFTDEEFRKLVRAKKRADLSWHDFIMTLAEDKTKYEQEI